MTTRAITSMSLTRQSLTSNTFVAKWYISSNSATYNYDSTYKKKKKTYHKAANKTVSFYNQISDFTIKWRYRVGSQWYIGEETTEFSKGSTRIDGLYQTTYSPPSETVAVSVTIYANSGSYSRYVGKSSSPASTKFFSTISLTKTLGVGEIAPNKPSTPSVEVSGTSIKASVNNVTDPNASSVVFYFRKNGIVQKNSGTIKLTGGYATWTYPALENSTYEVYCVLKSSNGTASEPSDPTTVSTVPSIPQNVTATAGSEEGTVVLDWDDVPGVSSENGYTVEYANNKTYFDASSNVQSASSTASTCILSIDLGYVWYFRVKASNDAGQSGWSKIVEQMVAKPPEAPTTWTNKSSFSVGENVDLYFTHNSEDNSKLQEYAVSYKVNGVLQPEIIQTAPSKTEENPIYQFRLIDGQSEFYRKCEPQPAEEEFDSDKERYYVQNKEYMPIQITEDEFDSDKTRYFILVDSRYIRCTSESIFDPEETYYIYEYLEGIFIQCTDESIYDPIDIYYEKSQYTSDTTVLWKIKTKGVHPEYGKYSIEREIKIYVVPALSIDMDETIEGFPIEIELTTTPSTQKSINYGVSIKASESYESMDIFGNSTYVVKGTEVYSKVIVNSENVNPYVLMINPSELMLENGQKYEVYVSVSMDSGLTAEDVNSFTVEWAVSEYSPEANLLFDDENYICYISPYCYSLTAPYAAMVTETTFTEDQYTFDDEIFKEKVGENYGPYVFSYKRGWKYNNSFVELEEYGIELADGLIPRNGNEFVISYDIEQILESDVAIDIYRKNSDNTFTEIITAMPNDGNSMSMDPHPSFGKSEYRVIARNVSTGVLGFNDVGIENNISKIVIQWDEKFENVVSEDEFYIGDEPVEKTYTGTIVELPYNIKTSETNDKDVSLVEFIGRKHPVSYYGTQRGSTANWDTEIPKYDTETLSKLRLLDVYPGDVYVREPYGTGYKANVSVSFNIDYSSLVIPVTINVKHVEE